MMSEEALLQMSDAEQAFYAGIPFWATAAFACAVFASLLASLALVLLSNKAKNNPWLN